MHNMDGSFMMHMDGSFMMHMDGSLSPNIAVIIVMYMYM